MYIITVGPIRESEGTAATSNYKHQIICNTF
jgi:hypothetical protein